MTTTNDQEITMTDDQTTTETEAQATASPEMETPAAEVEDTEGEGGSKAGREAAKYRRQLREVEAERDGLRGQIAAARDALLAETLSQKIGIGTDPRYPKDVKLDVWDDLFSVGGIDKAAMFDGDGNLDREALTTALRVTHESRPNLFGPSGIPLPDYSQGASPIYATEPTFTEAFGPRS